MLQRIFLALVCSGLLLVIACEKKPNEGISPTYGATGNPNPGAQTTTGNTTPTNPATENTSIQVGESGWSNPSCSSTNSLMLLGYNGTTTVTLQFASAIKSGTYAISTTPQGTTSCAMTIVNAPNQPSGIVWHGKTGAVSVLTTTSSINAFFTNVVCTQLSFGFPTVSASGVLGCSGVN